MAKPYRNLPVLPREEPKLRERDRSEHVRVGLVTLGCDKNTVDSERIMARLASGGAYVQSGADGADVVVINTCGFIDVAKEESIEAILDAVKLKQQGRIKAVVAMGCLVQRYQKDLVKEIPEVDAFISLTETEQLVPVLRERGLLDENATPLMERPLRLLSGKTTHTSYLKISEGCDHSCAFCAIPLMRGRHRSTPMNILIAEAQQLERSGVKELNIISQDTTWYGRDMVRGTAGGSDDYFIGRPFAQMPNIDITSTSTSTRTSTPVAGPRTGLLPQLLRELVVQTSIPWLRLFYMYPSGISRELVDLIASEPRIVPYLDMPLQHGSDKMLELMRRPERKHTIRERVQWLRDAVPDLALRTTLIVGFPGETDEDFTELLDLLEEIRFDYLGAFAYSPEEGTAAIGLPDMVPDAVKRERLEQLLELQRVITLEKNEARIGSLQTVLVDGVTSAAAVGRTQGQALEVDGVVEIKPAAGIQPGDFVTVRITGAADLDMIGEPARLI